MVFWRIVWVQPNSQELIEAALSIRKDSTVLLKIESPYIARCIKATRKGISDEICLLDNEILRSLLVGYRTLEAIQNSSTPSRYAIIGVLDSRINPVDRDCV